MLVGEGAGDDEESPPPPVEGVAPGVVEGVASADGDAADLGEAVGEETVGLGNGRGMIGATGLTSIDSGLLLAVCEPDRLLMT